MSLTIIWFVGSFAGAVAVREIGVEWIVSRTKRPEPLDEAQLKRLEDKTKIARAYVPDTNYMRARSVETQVAVVRPQIRTQAPRTARPKLSFLERAFYAIARNA